MPKHKPEGLRALWHVLATPFGVGISLMISPDYGVYLLFLVVALEELIRINFSLIHKTCVGYYGLGATVNLESWPAPFKKTYSRASGFVRYLVNEIFREDEMAGRPTAALAMSVGIMLAWIIAPREHFWISVICAAVIDPAARLTGIHYGATPFPGVEKKTCEGYLGALLAGAMASSAAGYPWPAAGMIGVAAASGEVIGRHEPWWFDDNLFVAPLVAITVRVLSYLYFLS
ncbi:MAG: hypothetical protein HZA95_00745 [Candidatus Vogelbacteria bacterium]|nr:hypothetical protein [Candidatus Vogelbacteria bacterium]